MTTNMGKLPLRVRWRYYRARAIRFGVWRAGPLDRCAPAMALPRHMAHRRCGCAVGEDVPWSRDHKWTAQIRSDQTNTVGVNQGVYWVIHDSGHIPVQVAIVS
jgi:hypothetical protein